MDIASAATALSQSKLANSIDYAVAGKALDPERQQGAAVVALIQSATLASDPTGQTGGQVDVVG